MDAKQYRDLVNKLEQINEAETFPTLKIGDIDPRNGKKILSAAVDGSGNVIRSAYGDIWNVQYGEPDPAPAPVADPVADPVVAPVAEPVADVKPVEPVKPCGPEVQAQIKAQKTFTAAYSMAKQSGCDTFDWCQIVTVPQEQGGLPAGDKWYSAPGMGTGSVVTPTGKPPGVQESELNAVLKSAGLETITEAPGEIPEIQAANKQAAIAQARKQGIKQFRFCSKYKVQAGKPQQQQGALPAAQPAAVGNPTLSRQTALGNPNIRPGSLRDRAAQANAARRPGEPTFNKE